MDIKIEESWKAILKDEFHKDYFKNLTTFIKKDLKNYEIYPPGKLIFNAFDRCPFDNTRVVILGQDPYHGPGQANGLCFSVNDGVKNPPSLVNIFKELKSDLNIDFPESGNLERWANQGILMLNATLTVRARTAGSHQGRGWEEFTDAVIKKLSDTKSDLVFILWGAYAQKKGQVIETSKHYVIKSPHPSPFSAYNGFFGSKPFSKTNDFLKSKGFEPIKW